MRLCAFVIRTSKQANKEWAAWLGGDYDETSYIAQYVIVPAENSTLSFWYWIYSGDARGSNFGKVMVGSTIIDTFDLCAAENTGRWTKYTANLSAYAGQNEIHPIR